LSGTSPGLPRLASQTVVTISLRDRCLGSACGPPLSLRGSRHKKRRPLETKGRLPKPYLPPFSFPSPGGTTVSSCTLSPDAHRSKDPQGYRVGESVCILILIHYTAQMTLTQISSGGPPQGYTPSQPEQSAGAPHLSCANKGACQRRARRSPNLAVLGRTTPVENMPAVQLVNPGSFWRILAVAGEYSDNPGGFWQQDWRFGTVQVL
jgi:hypothetical protein